MLNVMVAEHNTNDQYATLVRVAVNGVALCGSCRSRSRLRHALPPALASTACFAGRAAPDVQPSLLARRSRPGRRASNVENAQTKRTNCCTITNRRWTL